LNLVRKHHGLWLLIVAFRESPQLAVDLEPLGKWGRCWQRNLPQLPLLLLYYMSGIFDAEMEIIFALQILHFQVILIALRDANF
jgi:hypothetical protein